MDNFLGALKMKNAMDIEDEHDLTLSLRCGTSTPNRTSPVTLPPNPITSPQTNISFIELSTPSYPSFVLSSSTQQHISPLSLGSSSIQQHISPLSLGSSSTQQHISPLTLGSPSTQEHTNPLFLGSSSTQEHPSPLFLRSSSTQEHPSPLFLGSSSTQEHPSPLFLGSSSNYNPNPVILASSSNHNVPVNVDVNAPSAGLTTRRPRRASSQRRAQGKSETVPAPFPWATDRRATIHNRKYLMENNINTITGMVQCKRCEQEFNMTFDLEEKLSELKNIWRDRVTMHDRAPATWANPVLPKCIHCGKENSVKPILGADTKKRKINWLFLLLGQMIGCCTLDHLKYFCKHTNNHRTGAKDRLLYLAYMTLLQQLVPEWFLENHYH